MVATVESQGWNTRCTMRFMPTLPEIEQKDRLGTDELEKRDSSAWRLFQIPVADKDQLPRNDPVATPRKPNQSS